MKNGAPTFRKWLAVGTGAGIEIGADNLRVTLARVRPSGVIVLGAAEIERFRERPASDWGAEYAGLLRGHGARHLSATVLLPRNEVIVRQLALPGISDRDLPAAVQFQLDSLHPYAEEDVAWAWARLGQRLGSNRFFRADALSAAGRGSVIVALARREVIERYTALFAEAGIKVYCFGVSAAALYGALRLFSSGPGEGFLTLFDSDAGFEVYGESQAKPVFSAAFDLPRERAAALAASELRLPAPAEPVGKAPAQVNEQEPNLGPVELKTLLPVPKTAPKGYDFSRNALAYAAALAGACPRLALPLNLLPPEQRVATSRARLAPTAVLAALLLLALGTLASISPIEDRKYMAALEAEIARLEPEALKAAALDRSIEQTRGRSRLLDNFRLRSKADLDALAELTRLLEPPSWLSALELTRDSVTLAGEAEQAAALLKLLDSSPAFQASQFTVAIGRRGPNEVFRIRAQREGVPQ